MHKDFILCLKYRWKCQFWWISQNADVEKTTKTPPRERTYFSCSFAVLNSKIRSLNAEKSTITVSSRIESPHFRNVSSEIAPDREVTVFKKTTKPAQPTAPHQNFPANLKWRESAYWAQRTVPMNAASPRHLQGPKLATFCPIWTNLALPKSLVFAGQISDFHLAVTLSILNRFH